MDLEIVTKFQQRARRSQTYPRGPKQQMPASYFSTPTTRIFMFYQPNGYIQTHMDADFASRLRTIRHERALKRGDIADAAGVALSVYGRYERGERLPTVDTARAIADALGVSLDYLTGKTDSAVRDQRMLARLDAIEKLPAERRNILLDVLDAYVRDAKTAEAYAA